MQGDPGDRGAGSAPRIELIEDRRRFGEVAAAWDGLAAEDPGSQVFQGYPWLSTWLRHHPDVRPLLAVAWRGDVLTAALPLCAYDLGRWGLRVRSLRFAADLSSDYCDALTDPRYPGDLAALWESLARRRDWHLMDLRYMPATSRLAAVAGRAAGNLQVVRQQQDTAPYLDVRTDWRETVSRDHRTEVLRRRRRANEQGELRFDLAATPEEVDAMLEELAALHIARWRARRETSVFRFEAHREWMRDVCRELLTRRQLYLCRLTLDGRPMSIALGFLAGRRLLRYTSTFDEAYARFGPVHLLLMAVVEDVRSRDVADVHDFGRGGESYKARWTRQAQTVERLLVTRRTPAGRVVSWWSGSFKAFLWSHPRLGTAVRELRRRISLRRPKAGRNA